MNFTALRDAKLENLQGLRSAAQEELTQLSSLPTHGVEIEYETTKRFSLTKTENRLAETGRFLESRRMAKHKFFNKDCWFHMEEEKLTGGELVSPVFENKIPLAKISQMTTILQESNTTTTSASGLHVHVGVSPLTTESSWYDLFKTFHLFQKELYSVASSPDRTVEGSHRASESVKTLAPPNSPSGWLSLILQFMKKNSALTTFNVVSMESGTLEFRLWDGTHDPMLIGFYIAVSTALVTAAGDGRLSNPDEISDLGKVLFPDSLNLAQMFTLLSSQTGHPDLV